MSYTTIIGILCGFLVIAVSAIHGSNMNMAYINVNGFLIVIGGTFFVTLASFPLKELANIFGGLKMVFLKESVATKQDIDELIKVGRLWYKGDLSAIEDELNNINNAYLRTGIQLIIDGTPLDDILQLLNWRIMRLKQLESSQANIFRAMANYAPAFGMLGTLIGLVNMMRLMEGKDFAQIGTNMGIALITTFYGIILANVLFKPIAIKLERRTEKRVIVMKMITEGVMLISQKRTPSFIRETLKSFVIHYPDELSHKEQNELYEAVSEKKE